MWKKRRAVPKRAAKARSYMANELFRLSGISNFKAGTLATRTMLKDNFATNANKKTFKDGKWWRPKSANIGRVPALSGVQLYGKKRGHGLYNNFLGKESVSRLAGIQNKLSIIKTFKIKTAQRAKGIALRNFIDGVTHKTVVSLRRSSKTLLRKARHKLFFARRATRKKAVYPAFRRLKTKGPVKRKFI